MQLTFWRVLLLLGAITLLGGLFRLPFMAGYHAGFNAGYDQGKRLFSQDAAMAREKLWEMSVQMDSAGIQLDVPPLANAADGAPSHDSGNSSAAAPTRPTYRLAN